MEQSEKNRFSGAVIVFRDQRLPVTAQPAGYAALIDAYSLKVPLPRTLCAIGERHKTIVQDGWRIFTPRHAPKPTLEGHMTFALKYEGLDLAVLKCLFIAVGPKQVERLVRAAPTGSHARRIWFLFEWLVGETLDLPNAKTGVYPEIVNRKQQYAGKSRNVPRQRVKNNLPGTPEFCPLVFKTKALDRFIGLNLSGRAADVVKLVPKDLLSRTAAFLLLKDSKSSFAIENEKPPQERIRRWGHAIGEAGKHPLDRHELLRLQEIVIGDARFVHLGLRKEGGFVGEHDRATQMPLPDHINARHDDLSSLLDGMIAFDQGVANDLDAVIAAAVLAFGFVYAHPFEDGNGRIHRYLIHHVLAQRGFNPPGIVFPVSAAILDRIESYKQALESYSARLLPHIQWEPTERGNVRILNDTMDFYRYFDATPHAEFLYGCVERTIEEDLPNEARFLQAFDQFERGIEAIVDMPGRKANLLFNFLHQNEGHLSRRARTQEFKALTDDEVEKTQTLYAQAFAED